MIKVRGSVLTSGVSHCRRGRGSRGSGLSLPSPRGALSRPPCCLESKRTRGERTGEKKHGQVRDKPLHCSGARGIAHVLRAPLGASSGRCFSRSCPPTARLSLRLALLDPLDPRARYEAPSCFRSTPLLSPFSRPHSSPGLSCLLVTFSALSTGLPPRCSSRFVAPSSRDVQLQAHRSPLVLR